MFRLHYKNRLHCLPSPVYELVSSREIRSGVQVNVLKERLVNSVSLPRYTEYRLYDLISAGVPLERVNPVYDSSVRSEDISLVNQLLKSENNE